MLLIIGLGTNIGNRRNNLRNAIKNLSDILIIKKVSHIYESKALLQDNAPKKWDKDFLNMAILCDSQNAGVPLLNAIKEVEGELGRDLNAPKFSPRIIDIDILIADSIVINSDILKVPHSQLLNRDFALLPASEVAPKMVFPHTKKTLQEHLNIMKNFKKITLKNLGMLDV